MKPQFIKIYTRNDIIEHLATQDTPFKHNPIETDCECLDRIFYIDEEKHIPASIIANEIISDRGVIRIAQDKPKLLRSFTLRKVIDLTGREIDHR